MVHAWLREVCPYCFLTVLPGPALVLHNNVLQTIFVHLCTYYFFGVFVYVVGYIEILNFAIRGFLLVRWPFHPFLA